MVLTILEVSQKQAYIFSSNKLADNVHNSAAIAYITGIKYFKDVTRDESIFSENDNYVYAGGGHTVLQFADMEKARNFNEIITYRIHKDFPDIEVFVTNKEYEEDKSPSKNLSLLTEKLERKKALRKAAFHQGTFGIEKIDRNTQKPVRINTDKSLNFYRSEIVLSEKSEKLLPESLIPGTKWILTNCFEDLKKKEAAHHFLAVIHIDGNGMGARVEEFYKKYDNLGWEEFRKKIRDFSECIDNDFKDALKVTFKEVSDAFLTPESGKDNFFPIRRIISSGDDICLVTEGSIGIETAVRFIKNLNKIRNKADQKEYDSCAGVALVPQKFPFYRAYELSESLCSSAKRFGASLSKKDNGASVSSVDWHIEFGEPGDNLEEIRNQYRTADGKHLELRPYIVCAREEVLSSEPIRQFENFKKLMNRFQSSDSIARSKIKKLRSILKEGEDAAEYFIDYSRIDEFRSDSTFGIFTDVEISKFFTGNVQERSLFRRTNDNIDRSLIFDAIEIMDVYASGKE